MQVVHQYCHVNDFGPDLTGSSTWQQTLLCPNPRPFLTKSSSKKSQVQQQLKSFWFTTGLSTAKFENSWNKEWQYPRTIIGPCSVCLPDLMIWGKQLTESSAPSTALTNAKPRRAPPSLGKQLQSLLPVWHFYLSCLDLWFGSKNNTGWKGKH